MRFAFIALLAGCVHLSPESVHGLACREACMRAAVESGHDSAAGWYVGDHACGCRFDDGTLTITPERPSYEP